MARYGRDFDDLGGWRGGGFDRDRGDWGRGDWNRGLGNRGFGDRGMLGGGLNRGRWGRDYDEDFDRGYTSGGFGGMEGGGYYSRGYGRDYTGMRGGFGMDRDLDRGYMGRGGLGRHRDYDVDFHGGGRDLGDRLREGWHDLRRGAQRIFHRGYDRNW